MIPITNAAASTTRFRMDPGEQVQGLMTLEQERLDLLAIYHSHPSGPSEPSATDLAEARYPGVISLIWHPDGGGWRPRGFLMEAEGWREVAVRVLN